MALNVPAGAGDTFGEGGDLTKGEPLEELGAELDAASGLTEFLTVLWCCCKIPPFGAVPSSCARFPAC